jgi:membrane protein implicated in regulation of membrane protease activity
LIALIWVVVGVGFLIFELHHVAFYAIFVALGCFAAAAVALLADDAYGLQAGVASVVAVGGAVGVRPFVSAAYERRRTVQHVAKGVHGGIIGHEAVTVDTVGDGKDPGHVRFAGERWLAVSGSGDELPAGTRVTITAVSGTTLTVWPLELDHILGSKERAE